MKLKLIVTITMNPHNFHTQFHAHSITPNPTHLELVKNYSILFLKLAIT